jgi:hypothetical protein
VLGLSGYGEALGIREYGDGLGLPGYGEALSDGNSAISVSKVCAQTIAPFEQDIAVKHNDASRMIINRPVAWVAGKDAFRACMRIKTGPGVFSRNSATLRDQCPTGLQNNCSRAHHSQK